MTPTWIRRFSLLVTTRSWYSFLVFHHHLEKDVLGSGYVDSDTVLNRRSIVGNNLDFFDHFAAGEKNEGTTLMFPARPDRLRMGQK